MTPRPTRGIPRVNLLKGEKLKVKWSQEKGSQPKATLALGSAGALKRQLTTLPTLSRFAKGTRDLLANATKATKDKTAAGASAAASAAKRLRSRGAKLANSAVLVGKKAGRRALGSAINVGTAIHEKNESMLKAQELTNRFLQLDLARGLAGETTEAKSKLLLDKVERVIAEVRRLSGSGIGRSFANTQVERILVKTREEILKVHLQSNTQAETPDLSVFRREGKLMRAWRRLNNFIWITTGKVNKITPPTFSSEFWAKYKGSIVETADGKALVVPQPPAQGEQPVFVDAITGKPRYTFLDAHRILNPLEGGSGRITLVHSNLGLGKILARVEQLRRG